MLSDYVVLDDILPIQYINFIEHSILTQQFNYIPNIGREVDKYKPGFTIELFYDNQILSPLFSLSASLLYLLADEISYNVQKILQSRIFLHLPIIRNYETDEVHKDMECEHLVFLYYVSDSDGPTVIYDKTSIFENKNNILTQIEPKKGRCVFFNGKYFHCSTPPTKSTRCVLNIDFV